MTKTICTLIFIFSVFLFKGQVGISTSGISADPSAGLDVTFNDKGVLIPRLTAAQKNSIIQPANGLLIYQTDSEPGFYFNYGTALTPDWKKLSAGNAMSFSLNSDISSVAAAPGGNTAVSPIVLTCTYNGGDPSALAIQLSGLPSGVSYTLSQTTGLPSFTSTLIFNLDNSVSPGVYSIDVSASGSAGVKTIPIILNVITTKKVFHTSATYNGNLGGLSGADAKCQAAANSAGLSGTYVAWLSVTGIDAKDRITDAKYIRTDGAVIANSKADLLNTFNTYLQNEIDRDENGNPGAGSLVVWTGTQATGIIGGTPSCGEWTSTSGNGWNGRREQQNSAWTYNNLFPCTDAYKLFCFEQ